MLISSGSYKVEVLTIVSLSHFPVDDVDTNITLWLSDQICTSPYCQPYNSHDVSSENLVLDQPIIPKLIVIYILITYLVNIVLIL